MVIHLDIYTLQDTIAQNPLEQATHTIRRGIQHIIQRIQQIRHHLPHLFNRLNIINHNNQLRNL